MPTKKQRHLESLPRFASILVERDVDGPVIDAAVTAGLLPSKPLLRALRVAQMFRESSWPDLDGKPRASLGPDPFAVLALARVHLRGRQDYKDRDVATWAVWTFCQIPRTPRLGRPRLIDLDGQKVRVQPEAIGVDVMADLLRLPTLSAAFPGSEARRRGDVPDAINRVKELIEQHGEESVSIADL